MGGMMWVAGEEQAEEDWVDIHADDRAGELVVHRLVGELHKLVPLSSSLIEDSDIPPLTYRNW